MGKGRVRLTTGKAPAIRYQRGHYTSLQQHAKEMQRKPSPPELLLRDTLAKAETEYGWHFLNQVVMEGRILDFYEPKARLCVEVDGAQHAASVRRDAERDEMLERRAKVITLRFDAREVFSNPLRVLSEIRDVYAERIAGKEPRVRLNDEQRRAALRLLRAMIANGKCTHNEMYKMLGDKDQARILRALLTGSP